MPQLLKPRTRSLPLDAARALHAAFDLAREVVVETTAGPVDFDRALQRVEAAIKRCRSAFLAQTHQEAEAALAYHKQAEAELNDGFVPLYYRKAVLDNVLARYERTAARLVQTA